MGGSNSESVHKTASYRICHELDFLFAIKYLIKRNPATCMIDAKLLMHLFIFFLFTEIEVTRHNWAWLGTQTHVTQEVHNSAKWSRQQWSIMWEWALHKSLASKNRNVAMLNRSRKRCVSKLSKEPEWNLD